MRRLFAMMAVLIAAASLAGCGGGSTDGSTSVTINVGAGPESETAGDVGAEYVPPSITAIRFTCSGQGMTTMLREVAVTTDPVVSETFEVPNGPARLFLVEAAGGSGNVLYAGSATRDLDGTPLSIAIEMAPVSTGPNALKAWGYNFDGQLGTGVGSKFQSPEEVLSMALANSVSAGSYHSLATKDGTVWAWGFNWDGQLGIGNTTSKDTPVQVAGLSGYFKEVSAGYSHSLALRADGTVWAWGDNYYGQLGDRSNTSSSVPVQVAGVANAVAVSAGGYHSMALLADGTVWAWGSNWAGQLGNGSNVNSNVPVQAVNVMDGSASISAGSYHSLAIDRYGNVWGWGYNYTGQLGDATNTNRNVPTPVSNASIGGAVAVAAGANHSLAIDPFGNVWGWGYNRQGQLGDGTGTDSNVPVQTVGSSMGAAVKIAAEGHSFAIDQSGNVWGWGLNRDGQLGDGTTADRDVPVKTLNAAMGAASAIEAGSGHSLAVGQPTKLWAWGYNGDGQLGIGSHNQSPLAVDVEAISSAKETAGGYWHSLALLRDGTVWAWGSNASGQLGDSTFTDRYTPVRSPGISAVSIAAGYEHSLALKGDGTVWAWGSNTSGQLGSGALSPDSTVPVLVNGLSGVVAVDGGSYYSLALKGDGTVWAWGSSGGEFARAASLKATVGAELYYGDVPVQVAGIDNITAVSAGTDHALALRADGTVWAWGDNYYGQLGDGTGVSSDTPVATNISGVVAISAGGWHSLALKADGTVWAWGANWSGQLGDGTFADTLGPVPADPLLAGVRAIAAGESHSVFLMPNGTLSACGGNWYGQLGDGGYLDSAAPVAVEGVAEARGVSSGGDHTLAIVAIP